MDKDLKETSEEMVRLKVRTFIALIISVITITNSFTLVWQKIHRNEEQQVYFKERADRVSERKLEQAKEYFDREKLLTELEDCKKFKETHK